MAKPKLTIYTDGACSGNPGPGGWGVLFQFEGQEKTMSGGEKNTTNNRMEMMAVIMALEYLEMSCDITLYTDSQYVQNGVNKWMIGWKKKGWKNSTGKPVKNIDLWKRIDKQTKRHDVEFKWVKGHSSHRENDIVDKLAVNEIK